MTTQADKVKFWTTGYNFWKASQGHEVPPEMGEPQSFESEPCAGFYRKGVYEKIPNKRSKRVGWEPVAIWRDADGLHALVGNTNADPLQIWTFCCGNPIPEAWYRAVEGGQGWPDDQPPPAAAEIPAANREVAKSDNAEPEQPINVQHATAVDNAIAASVKKVANEADAAKALGSKNRIAELRLAADKAGKAIYEPIYRVYTAEQKKWSPIVARATAEEKRLNTEILTFREKERVRIAAENAKIEAARVEEEERNARAADRAIAAGEPEPPPVIAPAPEPVAAAPILPTYGTRKIKEELKKFVVVDDISAVFAQFKTDPQIVERLTKLAQAEIDAGRNVPGTHYREGLV